jgi:hypothetical protein
MKYEVSTVAIAERVHLEDLLDHIFVGLMIRPQIDLTPRDKSQVPEDDRKNDSLFISEVQLKFN